MFLDTCKCLKLSDFTLAQSVNDPTRRKNFMSDARTWFQIKQLSQDPGTKQLQNRESSPNLISVDYLPSPLYAAPEVFAGSGFSFASDLWSLGCVVFEMVTGRRPFCESSLEALRDSVCSGTGSAVEDCGRELGAWSRVVCSLLAKPPSQR